MNIVSKQARTSCHHNTLIMAPDNGHTKICPCGERHGRDLRMIGKQRTLEIKKCATCATSDKDKTPKPHSLRTFAERQGDGRPIW